MERMYFLGIDMVMFESVFHHAFGGYLDYHEPQEYIIIDCADDGLNCEEDAISESLLSLSRLGHLAIKLGYDPVGGASAKIYMSKDKCGAIAWQSFRLKKLAEGALDCWKKYQERRQPCQK